MRTFHYGKRPASPLRTDTPEFRPLLRSVTGSLPPIPHNFGHGYDFGASNWGMLANGPCDDETIPASWYVHGGVGNCFWAGSAHEEMESARNAHRPIPRFTCLNVANQYAEYLGLKDAQALNRSNDQGTNVQEAISLRQTKGLVDADGTVYKIGQHVALTPGDLSELWAAAYLFECVGIGVNLQEAQEQAFPGRWDYVKGSPTVGGHYIPVMGNNGLISWGDRVGFTQAFYEHCNDESFAYIDPERYNRVTGETLEHYRDADLEKYLSLVAKAKAA